MCKFQVSTVASYLFVFELQNKKIGTREIEWISNVNILNSKAHKNLIWLSGRRFLFYKSRQTYEVLFWIFKS